MTHHRAALLVATFVYFHCVYFTDCSDGRVAMGDPFVRPGVACEKYNDLVLRHPGTGHSDTSKHEWLTHQHRDTLASLAGHYDRVLHLSVAENVSVARLRHHMLEQLAGETCGPAPRRAVDDIAGVEVAQDGQRRPPRSEVSRSVANESVVTAADVADALLETPTNGGIGHA